MGNAALQMDVCNAPKTRIAIHLLQQALGAVEAQRNTIKILALALAILATILKLVNHVNTAAQTGNATHQLAICQILMAIA